MRGNVIDKYPASVLSLKKFPLPLKEFVIYHGDGGDKQAQTHYHRGTISFSSGENHGYLVMHVAV